MKAGNLHVRCTRCANSCRIRLVVDDEGTVTEARKQIPGRHTSYEKCPNLSRDEGTPLEEWEKARRIAK